MVHRRKEDGGTIFTRKLIFERPDLLNQCPIEVREAIVGLHDSEVAFSQGRYEKAHQLKQNVYENLDAWGNAQLVVDRESLILYE